MSERIGHFFPYWLPSTMGWIHNQLVFAEPFLEQIAIFDQKLEGSPYDWNANICLSAEHPLRNKIDIVRRKLGWNFPESQLLRVLKTSNIALLHSHFGHIGWENQSAAQKAKLPHIVSVYGNDVSYLPAQKPVWKRRYQEFFPTLDAILCEGPAMKMRLLDLGAEENRVIIQHLGVVLDDLHYVPHKMPKQTISILLVASFREKKGIPTALRALALLRNRFDLRLTIVGDVLPEKRSRDEKKAIDRWISELGLEGVVIFKGFRDKSEIYRLSTEHDLFLHPSQKASDGDTEGGAPVILLEMAAAGIPVISTKHDDIPYVLPHLECSLLGNERDEHSVAECIQESLLDWDATIKRAERARKRIEDHFDARKQGEKLAGIYKDVLAGYRTE